MPSVNTIRYCAWAVPRADCHMRAGTGCSWLRERYKLCAAWCGDRLLTVTATSAALRSRTCCVLGTSLTEAQDCCRTGGHCRIGQMPRRCLKQFHALCPKRCAGPITQSLRRFGCFGTHHLNPRPNFRTRLELPPVSCGIAAGVLWVRGGCGRESEHNCRYSRTFPIGGRFGTKGRPAQGTNPWLDMGPRQGHRQGSNKVTVTSAGLAMSRCPASWGQLREACRDHAVAVPHVCRTRQGRLHAGANPLRPR